MDAAPPILSPPKPETSAPAREMDRGLSAGTVIPVQLQAVIDSSVTGPSFSGGIVPTDVNGPQGRVAIPAGSPVVMAIRLIGRKGPISKIVLGLYAIVISGHEYPLSNGSKDPATLTFTEDAGEGLAHGAVHLQYGARLDFKLDTPVRFR